MSLFTKCLNLDNIALPLISLVEISFVWLAEKWKQAKGSKKLKQRLTVTFFVNAAGEKQKTIAIWKSKKKLQDLSRPANVRYFWNPKSWMTSEAMEAVMVRFNRKFVFEGIKVIPFFCKGIYYRYICCRIHQFQQKCSSVWANDQWIRNGLATTGQRRQH